MPNTQYFSEIIWPYTAYRGHLMSVWASVVNSFRVKGYLAFKSCIFETSICNNIWKLSSRRSWGWRYCWHLTNVSREWKFTYFWRWSFDYITMLTLRISRSRYTLVSTLARPEAIPSRQRLFCKKDNLKQDACVARAKNRIFRDEFLPSMSSISHLYPQIGSKVTNGKWHMIWQKINADRTTLALVHHWITLFARKFWKSLHQ